MAVPLIELNQSIPRSARIRMLYEILILYSYNYIPSLHKLFYIV